MIYFLGIDRFEMKTKFEFQKFKEIIENKPENLNIYVKVVILIPNN